MGAAECVASNLTTATRKTQRPRNMQNFRCAMLRFIVYTDKRMMDNFYVSPYVQEKLKEQRQVTKFDANSLENCS